MKHKDGYEQFFEYFNIDTNDLWNFAKESIVTVDIDKAILQWNLIKSAIEEGTEPVIVRNYGLKGVNAGLYLDLYRHIVPNAVIKIDPTNNTYPPKILAKYTGYYKKVESLRTELVITKFHIYLNEPEILIHLEQYGIWPIFLKY
ncbi:hypothetical protein [Staphylococcus chromogenes]|uniref:hypothetical protein n=1 Tax=Staphylococcus chromogenes TaxID=46126 RepID=UPI000E6900F1|nr:hypothetical protein [Staphylococcus chromogenes]RIM28618.1 hypothetical protein BU652_11140 [Staphylococcus chromogenes]